MIRGLGVDIVEIDRMRAALRRHPRLRERCFSVEEQEYCEGRSRPEVHYALRFAAKEAVLKALGSGFSGIRFTDVEVARDPKGRPIPKLHGQAAELAARLAVTELHLSLSYTHVTAVASAVAIAAGSSTAEPAGSDPISSSFKDARGILDEVE